MEFKINIQKSLNQRKSIIISLLSFFIVLPVSMISVSSYGYDFLSCLYRVLDGTEYSGYRILSKDVKVSEQGDLLQITGNNPPSNQPPNDNPLMYRHLAGGGMMTSHGETFQNAVRPQSQPKESMPLNYRAIKLPSDVESKEGMLSSDGDLFLRTSTPEGNKW